MCWGWNKDSQLGDGTTIQRSTPVNVVELTSGVTAITTGFVHTCALVSGGGVRCWGWNDLGQLGDGTTTDRSTPVEVVGLASGVTAIAAGGFSTCALISGGGVKCWGDNQYGQLGDGTTVQRNTPVDVGGLSISVMAIATGGFHTCALTSGGGVKCWGENWKGQLGDGTTDQRSTPVDVVGLTSGVTAITASEDHTCALTSGGGVKCWGMNWSGQLGNGTHTQSSIPVEVSGLASGVTGIAAGTFHTCALLSGGGARCWGWNEYGQLGDGTTTNRSTPVEVTGLASGATAITTGMFFTCALIMSGGARCWGSNGESQLGDGTTTQRSTPVEVTGLAGSVPSITAGGEHACVLASGGGARCWGYNQNGQLGDGTRTQRSTPVDVSGLTSGVTSITASRQHTCALITGEGVKCWGDNGYGQLGDGTTTDRSTPVDVVGLGEGVTAIATGGLHTCTLVSGGGMKCWGWNGYGQLGDGTATDHSTPVDVVGLGQGVTAITAGEAHTCALTSGGGVKCWGSNQSGQLGNGTSNQSSTPVEVSGLASGVTTITAAGSHTCALASGGWAKCWGANWDGQLGDSTTNQSNIPVDVTGLTSGTTAITAGTFHTCALTSGGGVKCWGRNESGQLGDGTTNQSSTPVNVDGLGSGVTAITAGVEYACALAGSDRPKCWGSDNNGQLGIGTIVRRLTPVDVVESTPPSLTINYSNGQPGSFFTITGWNFPPGAQATLSINGQAITTTLSVNPTGSFIFFLDTHLAEPGGYAVTISVNPGASTGFLLADDAPLRPQEGGGLTFFTPPGIALHNFVYLPVVTR
jgi:alpha-tubulin suppressor-like RCC1 family protein